MIPVDLTDRIRAEALRQFAARGFDGTSVRDVASALGISPGNLTYHFPKKTDLFLAAIERPYGTFLADLRAISATPDTTARQRLRALIERLGALSEDERSVLRIGMRALVTAPEHLSPVVHLFRDGHPVLLMQAVQAAIAEGGLPDGVGLGVVPIIVASLFAAPVIAEAALRTHGGFDIVRPAIQQINHDLLRLLGYDA